MIRSIHIAKGAIIAVVRRVDCEGLRQVQNCFVPDEDLRGRNDVPLQLLHLLLRDCSLSLLIIHHSVPYIESTPDLYLAVRVRT